MLLNDFILKYYDSIFKKTVSPYYLVTGRFGITDHYAGQAKENNMSMLKFASFCATISGLDRDNFNKNLLSNSNMNNIYLSNKLYDTFYTFGYLQC